MAHYRASVEEAEALVLELLRQHGASSASAASVARALVEAQLQGKPNVGLAHLPVYLDSLKEGRADGQGEPVLETPAPAVLRVDARQNFPQLAFDLACDAFVSAVQNCGIAVLSICNGYTSGELGYYVRRLTDHGLVGLGMTNAGPAVMAASGGTTPVFCTNPLAFAVPRKSGPPLVIDQSSSATALVKILKAAESGETIPEGWALDSNGKPTRDPKEALRGVFLAFGGQRGANLALMVELLAAGVTGANWSVDAPAFNKGDRCPGTGVLLIALQPDLLLGADFDERCEAYLTRLAEDHHAHLPGIQRGLEAQERRKQGVEVSRELWQRLQELLDLEDECDLSKMRKQPNPYVSRLK